ncbi:uncharacterized protein B0I36DRAFT_425768 [Microdochium trichocladiopsis]|uniref:NACHT domain-containing protein n=1 Tax=Microdochium trichocladiopsis TaxID=1682393 RepID=A0A9P9BG42_9PEZI|nr:uncharacterized protein B0I36DRAFT_425768 [Microdochium trichocladiopsis]KAH7014279.1 hypothetical protein B0I36DRAFT_425768 [Microdochium trichocladiopsis]
MAETLGLVASVIAVVDLSSKLAKLCFTYSREVSGAQDDIFRFQERLAAIEALARRLQDLLRSPQAPRDSHASLQAVLHGIRRRLGEAQKILEPSTSRLMMSRVGVHALKWPFKSKAMATIIADLLQDEVAILAFLQADQTETLGDVRADQLLKRLPVVHEAAYDSFDEAKNAKCLRNTRVKILEDIDTWLASRDSKHVYWLNGRAGTGKSTIARTVADGARNKGMLGATFFFKRGEGERSSAAKLMTTLAWQLSQQDPLMAREIKGAIEKNEALVTTALRQQFDGLILQPVLRILNGAATMSPRLVVIDALDECDETNDMALIIDLFSKLPQHANGAALKLLVTSRPELPIRLGFKRIDGKYDELILHEIQESTIQADIACYLSSELKTIRDDFNSMVASPQLRLSDTWPSPGDADRLVNMAVPLFIFAATIVRFLSDTRSGGPQKKMSVIFEPRVLAAENKLIATYQPVLAYLLAGQSQTIRKLIERRFKSVVGSIVLLFSPLSASSLVSFLAGECDADDIFSILEQLHSVLDIPQSQDVPIRLYHLSFRDYLLDQDLSGSSPFWINAQEGHARLAKQCMKVMQAFLKQDMCSLKHPGAGRASITPQKIDACIPVEVQYACVYWSQHLRDSGQKLVDGGDVDTLLSLHFLHWVEVLAILGRAGEAIDAVKTMSALADDKSTLYRFLADAHRFVMNCLPGIREAPLQLYSSALVFAPLESTIRKQFNQCIPNDWLNIRAEVRQSWSPWLQSLESWTHSGLGSSQWILATCH